jgi:L-amino acid N-acyltransferase YncA
VAPTVRLAEPRDAEAILEIYNLEVRESTVTFDLVPRTLEDQLAWLAEHSGGRPAVVAVDGGGAVVGFGSLTPYKERPAYSPTVEDSVYVHRERRGNGVGRALLAELVRLAEQYGYHSVVARIVGGHDASIGLHAAHGFELVGVEREVGRKLGRWLDVVVMQKMLDRHT